MKKILSIVLAVAMLSTTAFAANMDGVTGTTRVNPDSTMEVYARDFTPVSKGDTNPVMFTDGELTSTNFSLTKKISKGSNLVKSVAINDDKGRVDIKFVADYSLTFDPTKDLIPNVIFEKLELKAKKKIDKWDGDSYESHIKSGDTYTMSIKAGFRVGYLETKDDVNGNYAEDGLVKFTKDGDESYGEASYDNGDISIFGRVYADDKVFTKFSSSVGDDQKAALKLYPEADLRFVNFTTNGLSANNTVLVYAEEDEFVYEIKDGKVVSTSLKWDDEDGAWKGKTRSSVSYVISDVKLDVSSAVAADPANPETGANDVVGVAAALAVVSLVAAGAVSLKK